MGLSLDDISGLLLKVEGEVLCTYPCGFARNAARSLDGMDSLRSILRAAAIAAFTVGLLLLLLNPPSLSGAGGLLTLIAGVVVFVLVVAWLTVTMMGSDGPSEEEFERVVRRAERLARQGTAAEPDETEFMDLDPYDDADFEELVSDALDDLPDLLRKALEHNVAVVISDGGRRRGAYGLYHGDGATRDDVPDRIVIYRDTLRRDFGHDADLLREQVVRTVRHELAHHIGFDELGVRDLGL
jgi:predicted Zn-dependent protease with MMP-like domain